MRTLLGRPGPPVNDVADKGLRHSEGGGDSPLWFAGVGASTDLGSLLAIERMAPAATVTAPLRHPVGDVRKIGPHAQMGRVTAGRVVAQMHHGVEACEPQVVREFVRDSRRNQRPRTSRTHGELSIAALVARSHPRPAARRTRCHIDMRPEAGLRVGKLRERRPTTCRVAISAPPPVVGVAPGSSLRRARTVEYRADLRGGMQCAQFIADQRTRSSSTASS